MDDTAVGDKAQPEISRRTIIKAAAVVGGAAWAAPVIESFVYRAAAASGAPSAGGGAGACPGCESGIFSLAAGQSATVTIVTGNADSSAGDQLAFGYELDNATAVQLATKGVVGVSPGGSDFWSPFSAVISPSDGLPHTLRLYLQDTGYPGIRTCNFIYYSDGNHACARSIGPNSWDVTFADSFVCQSPYASGPRCPSDGNDNLRATLTIT
jgi:hypothetical protein